MTADPAPATPTSFDLKDCGARVSPLSSVQEPTVLRESLLLAQREFGLLGGDCRTTKMRKRDARAAIVANAARIRLCVKTVVAPLAQSPGADKGICTEEKSKTPYTSDI